MCAREMHGQKLQMGCNCGLNCVHLCGTSSSTSVHAGQQTPSPPYPQMHPHRPIARPCTRHVETRARRARKSTVNAFKTATRRSNIAKMHVHSAQTWVIIVHRRTRACGPKYVRARGGALPEKTRKVHKSAIKCKSCKSAAIAV